MFSKLCVLILMLSLTLGLTACGGGGGGGGNNPDPPTPRDQIITFTASSLTGQVGQTLTNTASGGAGVGAVTYNSENTAVATVNSNTGVVTLLSTGTITITATKAPSTGFNQATTTYTLVVTPGNQSIAFADAGPIDGVYGGELTNIASGGAGNGAITYQSSNTSIATVDINSGIVAYVGAGNVTITATKAADANYNQATASYQINIAKANQTIAFSSTGPISGTVEESLQNAAAGGSGSGAITYTSPNPSLVSVDANSGAVNLIGAGTATITATKAEDVFYNEATASYTINISKANQVINFANAGPIAAQVSDSVANTASGGNGSGSITYTSDSNSIAQVNVNTGQVTLLSIGSATITATKATDANYNAATATYTLNVSPGNQSITFSNPGPIAVQVDDMLTNTASGGTGVGAITYESNNMSVATVDLDGGQIVALATGTAVITATKAADINYNQSTTTFTLNVSPADQTISFLNPSPVNLELGNTNTNAAAGGNGSGLISYESSDSSIASVDATTGEVTANSVGSVVITATKAADTNYNQAQAVYDVNVSLITQIISFADPGPIQIVLGTTSLTNAASGGGGTGAITYESSDTNIATVDSTGVVSVVSAGNVAVTATKAANGDFAEAQASYDLSIENTVAVNGWAIAFNSYIEFPDFSAGTEFIRSTDPACNLNDPLNCMDGETNTIAADGTILDSTLGIYESGYFWLKNGSQTSSPMYASVNTFQERVTHNAVFFNDRYWVLLGGRTRAVGASTAFYNRSDVWSSADGKTWRPEAAPSVTSPWNLEAVVFQGKLWVIGNEIWSTDDGVTWTDETLNSNMTFPQTAETDSAVFNGEIWVRNSNFLFSSPDGVTWTQQADISAFAGRGNPQFIVYNNYLWFIGGCNPCIQGMTTTFNDVWRSDDGVDWQLVTSTASFPSRYQHAAFVLNNKLWILGGQNTDTGSAQRTCDTWSTSDGISWTEEVSNFTTDCSYLTKPVVANNTVKLVSGILFDYSSNVLESTDGVNWEFLSPHSQFSGRTSHKTLSFDSDGDTNQELFVIGGFSETKAAFNEVWQSSDAKTWAQVSTVGPIFEPRAGPGATVFDDQMWVVGGYGGGTNVGGNGVLYDDVWSSSDGQNWSQVISNGSYGPRAFFELVEFNSRLWLIGGSTDDNGSELILSDIWSSVDGVTWIEENAAAPFGPRTGHTVAEYMDQLWLVGGSDGTNTYNDVWTSSDGINWTQVTNSTAFTPRFNHAMEIHNGLMWVVGGTDTTTVGAIRNNEAWSSSDGINWTLSTNYRRFSRRSTHSLVSFGSDLCVIGGLSGYNTESWDHSGMNNDVWCSPNPNNQEWRVNYNNQFAFP